MLVWKIWYEGGATFTSAAGRPQDSPKFGVLAICQADENHGHLVLSGGEFYVFRDDLQEWLHVDNFGLHDQLIHYADDINTVRAGRFTTNQEFKSALSAALNDPEMPRRNALPAAGRKAG